MIDGFEMKGLIGILAALALLAGAAPAQAEAPRRFALVVGNNHPLPGHDYEALEYADDDALRFAAFMTRLGADVRLLVGADRASSERHPELARASLPPRRDTLLEAIADLDRDLRAAAGARREVYVYFSGHGSVTSSKAYLHLLDAPFTRTDLHNRVLERIEAEQVHVIIDSCHSYFLVNARGQRVPAQLESFDLSRHPRTGFLLSTSAKKEVQEWSGYEAGVFSYQLLGAMQGAADVDLDGRVTYAEAHAYIVAANLDVENPAARVQPFVHRPAAADSVLVDLRATEPQAKLQVPAHLAGHFHVVDGRGQRLLDAHKPADQGMSLMLGADRDVLLWSGRTAYGVQRQRGEVTFTRSASTAASMVTARGTIADEYRKNLFRRPLTREFVAGLNAGVAFDAAAPLRHLREPGPSPVSIGLMSAGGAAVLAGVLATAVYVPAKRDAEPDVFTAGGLDAVESARRRADTSRAVMVAGFSSGAALVLAGLLYEWLDAGPMTVAVSAGPREVVLGGRW